VDADIGVQALSMGVPHKAIPITLGLCVGVASGVRNTVAWEIMHEARKERSVEPTTGRSPENFVRLRHPGGIVEVGASFDQNGAVRGAQVVRTGRRLMKGVVQIVFIDS